MLDPQSSYRLKLLRFPLIVGIVFVHSFGSTVTVGGATLGLADTGPWVTFIRTLISQGLAQLCVPLLFAIAGYLFWQGFDGGLASYRRKLASRTQSLLLPYLIWNGAAVAMFWALPKLSATAGFFPAYLSLEGAGPAELIQAWLGWGRQPVLGHFWFIRDLMLMVLAAPLLFQLNRPQAPIFIVALAVSSFLGYGSLQLLCFMLGAYASKAPSGLFQWDRYWRPLGLAYVIVLLLDTLSQGEAMNPALHLSGLLLGMPVLLGLTKAVKQDSQVAKACLALSPSSFFVFASHWLVLAMAQKIAFKILLPDTPSMILILYFAVPIGTIVFLVLSFQILNRIFPRSMEVLSGGRSN